MDYEGQPANRLERGELTREEHDDALRLFREARDGTTNTAELGVRVMELFTDSEPDPEEPEEEPEEPEDE